MSTSTSPSSASPSRTSAPASTADRLRRAARRGWTPPPRISVPEWADRYRKLAAEAGSTSGVWKTSTVEVARGPMLAVTEPGVRTVTTMCCTQLMKTALLENVFGYFAHLDPAPMLLLQPKEDAAEQFSKERIAPMVRATPALRDLVGTSKTRNAEETLLFKAFPGGFLALAGAGSPDNLARRPIRVLLCDEVDKYPVTREGDPITLAGERLATFAANSLDLRACSPTVEGESRIDASYQESDQRRASCACPHCGHRQFLDFFRHVHWPKDGERHDWRRAAIHCEACGAAWSEGERLRALKTVRWHQCRAYECCGTRRSPPEEYERAWREGAADPVGTAWAWWEGDRWAVYRARCPDCGTWPVPNDHAGFQAGKLYSPWSRDTPADQARKWLAAVTEELKQAWWNTQAGLPYRAHSGKELKAEALASRAESWAAEVPDGVALLTAGLDTQGDRVEVEVVGWGRNEESWSLAYHVVEGDPESPEFWDEVDAYLKREWTRADGRPFRIEAACIDSGGNHTQKVYEFAKARLGRKIWAVKGESARDGQRSPVWPTKRPTRANKAGFRPVIIGTNAAKDVVRARLGIEPPAPGQGRAGYMHVPADRDLGWWVQLVSERLVPRERGGKRFRVWELPSGRANEALDCRVYAYAALCGLIHLGFGLNKRADLVAAVAEPAVAKRRREPKRQEIAPAAVLPAPDAPPPPVAPPPPKPQPAPRRSRWAS